MLSSSWLLNIDHLVILKQQQKKTSITEEKKIEGNKLEDTDEFTTSQTKLEIKQRIKTLTLLEHFHVRLFDVL